ncbi:MAG: AAA family ATPase [Acidimicrobiales bacterium]
MVLLERDEQVAAILDGYLQVDRGGQLVVISGEAGTGKSALVQALIDEHLDAPRVLVGRCDDLFAPQPLGPVADIARANPGPLADALASGDPSSVFGAFLAEVATPPHPSVVVLEDLQWADEATLDLLCFVARRLAEVPCLVLVTHRDDLAPEHPTRRALGSLSGSNVRRVHLPPLSVGAVTRLVGDRPLDPEALHARTAGNPFFVVELLEAQPGSLPASVREMVLSRSVPLSGAARDALDAAAVLGRAVTPELIQAVGDCDAAAVDECLRAGLLVDVDRRQVFRHDLSRQAVDEAMTPLRRRQLHGRALAALGEDADVVWRAHHAIGAGDPKSTLDLAWRAGDHCIALGAHRQAAALYGEALQYADRLPLRDLRRLLESRADTCLRVELTDAAVEAGERLLGVLEAEGDVAALSERDAWLSIAYHAVGRAEDAERAAERAVTRAEALGASEALARALANWAGTELIAGRYRRCIATSRRALDVAERVGLEESAIHALNTYGSALGALGEGGGIDALEESFDRAKRAGLMAAMARACANLGYALIVGYQPERVVPVYDEGIRLCEAHELRMQLNCLRSDRAEALLLVGEWDAAAADLGAVLVDPSASVLNRALVLHHLGRLRARRGDPGAIDALDEALALFEPMGEPQLVAPSHLARAELAWLDGDVATAASRVEAAVPFAPRLDRWSLRELALMARRAQVDWRPEGELDQPLALVLAGDHRSLSEFWASRGCPYEAADALVDSDDLEDVRRAHDQLLALGARPRAAHAARRLREMGAKDVPRGPRASTRANPAGLTAREVQVAALLAEGLTNAEVAGRLVVSQKTVDHHVSAVLSKLGVSSRRHVRRAAAELAVDLSPLEQTGQSG